jgi:hypothetical protein
MKIFNNKNFANCGTYLDSYVTSDPYVEDGKNDEREIEPYLKANDLRHEVPIVTRGARGRTMDPLDVTPTWMV